MLNNVLVTYKKSTWEMYSKSRDASLRELMRTTMDAEKLHKSHDAQRATLDAVAEFLISTRIPHALHHRSELKTIADFTAYDLIITVGGDGTLLEASHYVHGIPMLGVNSDPSPGGSIGYFSAANARTFATYLNRIDEMPRTVLNRMQVFRNGEPIREQVLNDILLAHRDPAATARYRVNGESHKRKSSGLIVCTAAGSTAWMEKAGGIVMPLESCDLQYRDRESGSPRTEISPDVEVYSLTRDGELSLDGPHIKYPFTLYDTIRCVAGEPLTVIGDLNQKRPWHQRGSFGKALYVSRRAVRDAVAYARMPHR